MPESLDMRIPNASASGGGYLWTQVPRSRGGEPIRRSALGCGVVMRAASALVALLLASSPIHASQKQIPTWHCHSIGSMLRAREQRASANDGVFTELRRGVDWKPDYSAWGPSADTVKNSGYRLANTDEVGRFGHSDIGVVSHTAGSALCQYFDFFRVVEGKVYPIDPPPHMPETCAVWGGSAWVGSLRGVPVFAAEQHGADASMQITLVPLLNGRWGPRCGIDLSFAPSFAVESDYCDAAECAVAREQAIASASRLATSQDQYGTEKDDPTLKRLVGLGQNTVGFGHLPTFGHEDLSPQITDPILFVMNVRESPALVMIGPWPNGPALGAAPIGYMVALWSASSDSLKPIAGFRLRTTYTRIKSISLHGY